MRDHAEWRRLFLTTAAVAALAAPIITGAASSMRQGTASGMRQGTALAVPNMTQGRAALAAEAPRIEVCV